MGGVEAKDVNSGSDAGVVYNNNNNQFNVLRKPAAAGMARASSGGGHRCSLPASSARFLSLCRLQNLTKNPG